MYVWLPIVCYKKVQQSRMWEILQARVCSYSQINFKHDCNLWYSLLGNCKDRPYNNIHALFQTTLRYLIIMGLWR